MMTLCGLHNCHLRVGHSGSWLAYNPHAAEDADRELQRIRARLYTWNPVGLTETNAMSQFAYPYPDSFPSADLMGLVTAALRGQGVNVKEAAHATYTVVGYGLGQWDSSTLPPAPAPVTAGPPLTAALAADVLEQHASAPEGSQVKAFALPWAQLMPILLTLLEQLLAKQGA